MIATPTQASTTLGRAFDLKVSFVMANSGDQHAKLPTRQLNKTQRTASQQKEAANHAFRRCDEPSPTAASRGKPVHAFVRALVDRTGNATLSALRRC